MDVDGNPLATGDTVHSVRKFDVGQIHVGKILRLHARSGEDRIIVRHRKGCCEPGRESDSEAIFWKLVLKRPTAWERLNREMFDD